MFKILFFLWRRPDLSPQQFRDYYENNHAPLGVSLSPPMADYRRNYPIWIEEAKNALGGFDVMTQIWHEERAIFDEQITTMQRPPAQEIIGADEARFINRDRQLFVTVEERGLWGDRAAEVSGNEATGTEARRKILRFVRAPSGIRSSFVDSYESEVVPGLNSLLPGLVAYRRNYVVWDDPYSFSGGTHNVSKLDPSVRIFDLVEEFWLAGPATIADVEAIAMASAFSRRTQAYTIAVQEHRSPGGRVLAPVCDVGRY